MRLQRLPALVKVLERRLVDGLVSPVRVPLERLASADGIAARFLERLLLGVQRVALLTDDPVDVLVLAMQQLLQELPQLHRIRHRLRRELADAARGAVEDERSALRDIDRGENARQTLGIARISRHGEECRHVHGRCAQRLELESPRIDELRKTLLRGALDARGHPARRAGTQSRQRPQTLAVHELGRSSRAQRLVAALERSRDEALRRCRIERRDRIGSRRRIFGRRAEEAR